MFSFLLPTITMSNNDKLEMYYTEGIKDPIWIIFFYLLFALFYIRKTFITNKAHKEYLLNKYASNDVELQLFSNHLVFLCCTLMITIPLSLSVQYFSLNFDLTNKILFIIFSFAPHFILISILTYKDTKHYKKMSYGTDLQESITINNLEKPKQELIDFMVLNKPYLNQNLNLQNLANSINWSRSNLSMVINKGFKKNFYDFINNYRLELVIEKISKGEYEDYSLDYLASESGFKNYVSFYRIFKKVKKESPNSYIKRLKKD